MVGRREPATPTFTNKQEYLVFMIQTKTSHLGRPTESLRGGPNITEQHQGLHRGLE